MDQRIEFIMSDFKSNIITFSNLCQLIDPRNKFISYSKEELIEIISENISDGLLLDRYLLALPMDDIEITWTGNPIRLYAPQNLGNNQQGYSIVQENRELLWDKNWLVIGDIGGDPIIVLRNKPTASVMMALHGIEEWHPMLILTVFLKF